MIDPHPRLIHALLSGLWVAAWAASAQAQQPQGQLNRGEKLMLAYCVAGQGCKGQLASIGIDDVQVVLPGTEALKGAKDPILVFPRNKAGEWTYYVDTRHQLGELHRLFGGVGQPQIALFAPVLVGEIQPRDGQWTVTVGKPVARDCLPGVSAGIARQMPMANGGKVAFKSPFHGRQLLDNPRMTWVKTEPNRYAGALKPPGQSSAGQSNASPSKCRLPTGAADRLQRVSPGLASAITGRRMALSADT